MIRKIFILTTILEVLVCTQACKKPERIPGKVPAIEFKVSFQEADSNRYHVDMVINKMEGDSIILKIPRWMPGYYQVMNYKSDFRNISVSDRNGREIHFYPMDEHTRIIDELRKWPLIVSYDIQTGSKFVARSYVDSTHAYILPSNSFFYPEGFLDAGVVVRIVPRQGWPETVTGLKPVEGTGNAFLAADFDILYDCPLLIGDLEELPGFTVDGVEHRFIAYDPGDFDRDGFMESLNKIVTTATGIIGDIPYERYTFIGIGPGYGGIEHLNNTTISFDGNRLTSDRAMKSTLAFIAHEYFHNYNVKRIRPFELGPFDYDLENRTNQLWISEGLTVYYEYLILRRAGLIDENEFLDFIEGTINAYENDEGRLYQSLQQASYYTWEYGPFGNPGRGEDRSISYYDKGAVVGLLLDFSIRNATDNARSLDDVLRVLYHKYYKGLQRGFTEAEFQQECERVSGIALPEIFEYVYTTKNIDYNRFLGYGGLRFEKPLTSKGSVNGRTRYELVKTENPSEEQLDILNSWQGQL